jgi:hypothetical protein
LLEESAGLQLLLKKAWQELSEFLGDQSHSLATEFEGFVECCSGTWERSIVQKASIRH